MEMGDFSVGDILLEISVEKEILVVRGDLLMKGDEIWKHSHL